MTEGSAKTESGKAFNKINFMDKAQTTRQNRTLSLWQPYKPSSYLSYNEALKGLFREGAPTSFYKGNGVRACHILLFHKLNTDLTFRVEQIFGPQWKALKQVPLASEFILSCSVDLLLQPLHVAETRFVI